MKINVTKHALTACGLVAGAYCIPAAFQSGLAIGVGLNGYIIGLVMVSVVIGSWLLGPLALARFRDRAWWQGGFLLVAWAVAFAVVLVNSVGFTAVNREKTVGTDAAKIETYRTAQADKARLTDELTKLQSSNEYWNKTSGCTTNLQWDHSKSLCREVHRLQNGIEVAQRTMAGGRPPVGDAQAETLASITGLTPAAVAKALPMWITVGMEVAANGFLFAAQAVGTPRATPRKKSKRKSKRSRRAGARPTVKRLIQSAHDPNVYHVEGQVPVADFREEKALRALTGRARKYR